MKDKLEKKILNSCDLKKLEEVRVEIFGKKGYLAVEFAKIKDIPNSFVVADNIEVGFENKIPLYLFGFLY